MNIIMANMQLHFNGNFALKKEDFRKIIGAAAEQKGLNDDLQGLMDRTSLGNAKVGRIKSWTIRAGLVKDNRLSPEGEIVWHIDSYLESTITDWLMHFYLSFGDKGLQPPPTQPADWGSWSYFVHTFLPDSRTFTHELFWQSCNSVFEEESRIIEQRIKYILQAYIKRDALANCKFLSLEDGKYTAGNAPLPNPYLIGYFLAKLWERDFGDTTSVLTNDILQQKMGLAPILGKETETLQECLNQLETLAIIEQRRTVSPAQIIRRWDNPLTLLEKAYVD
jgi:hypothetical protein